MKTINKFDVYSSSNKSNTANVSAYLEFADDTTAYLTFSMTKQGLVIESEDEDNEKKEMIIEWGQFFEDHLKFKN